MHKSRATSRSGTSIHTRSVIKPRSHAPADADFRSTGTGGQEQASALNDAIGIEGLDATSGRVCQTTIDIRLESGKLIEYQPAPRFPFTQSFSYHFARRFVLSALHRLPDGGSYLDGHRYGHSFGAAHASASFRGLRSLRTITCVPTAREIGRAVQQECRDRSRMPSSA
eukprot:TRINITY_DN25113_c0_g1_i1.p1 TRINITY_DN25113_c0_g1~~TRINITY_DN25113_c0_g1_i1.p1  ORF type:complete len:169 (+),score=22.54 TRINITY_DN25113_c0_g1_i1:209-715(+)